MVRCLSYSVAATVDHRLDVLIGLNCDRIVMQLGV